MVENGDFPVAISDGYVFLLGIMPLMADGLGTHLRRCISAGLQNG